MRASIASRWASDAGLESLRGALYVISTDPDSRRVTIGRDRELLCDRAFVSELNWISIAAPMEPVRAEVKIRNKHAAAPATILPTADPDRVEIHFDDAQRAVTPGQAAVFYSGDLVLGGGWIEVTAFELKARAYAKALDWGVPRLRRIAIRNLELAGFADRSNEIADGVFLWKWDASCSASPSFRQSRARMFTNGSATTAWKTSRPHKRRDAACWLRPRTWATGS